MDELVGEAGGLDDGAGGAVGLLAADRKMAGDAALDEGDGGVAGVGDDAEDARMMVGDAVADGAHPGEVAVDGIGVALLGEEVEEDEVAARDGGVAMRGRGEVGVGGVGVDGDDGSFVGMEMMGGDAVEDELLEGELGAWEMAADAPGDFAESLVDDLAQPGGGAAMAGELGGR